MPSSFEVNSSLETLVMIPLSRAHLAPFLLIPALGACALAPVAVIGGATTAAVTSEQQRSSKDALSDAEIRTRLNLKYSEVDVERFANVSINVVEGRLVLLGYVPDAATKAEAAQIAQSIKDVKTVRDHIAVGPPAQGMHYWRDVRISNSVRARFLEEPSVSAVDISVETQDAVVHLFGIARSEAELRKVAEIARTVPGVARVVSHVVVATDIARTAS